MKSLRTHALDVTRKCGVGGGKENETYPLYTMKVLIKYINETCTMSISKPTQVVLCIFCAQNMPSRTVLFQEIMNSDEWAHTLENGAATQL
jgi:hypothetical protein